MQDIIFELDFLDFLFIAKLDSNLYNNCNHNIYIIAAPAYRSLEFPRTRL